MKYVSKSFILKIPLIGWPMRLAGHIALRTESRRSQLETYKNTVAALQVGSDMRERAGRTPPHHYPRTT